MPTDAAHVQLLYFEDGWVKGLPKILEFSGKVDIELGCSSLLIFFSLVSSKCK